LKIAFGDVLIVPQLQRHSRGTLRPLWQIRPGAVRRPLHTFAILIVLSSHKILIPSSQIRQGIANNTKGTAFVVYEDVMDAKSACDKLNGFNFQNRYLVGMLLFFFCSRRNSLTFAVLYHQPDKMIKAANDLAERQENLEKLKKQHGID
jgi:pre-mRNA branch site protein p14